MNGVLGSQVRIRIEIRLRYYLVILLMECFAKMECLNILDCPDILECLDKSEWLNILGCPHRSKDLYRLELLDRPEILDWLDLMYWLVVGKYPLYQLWRARGGWVGRWVYLDYSISSGSLLRFSMRFEFLSEISDHSVCETRNPSLTIASIGLGLSHRI